LSEVTGSVRVVLDSEGLNYRGMKVFVLLALASTAFAGVVPDASEYKDLSIADDSADATVEDAEFEEGYEYGEIPEQRAAAAISSTDTFKEEETIKKQIDIKNSGRYPPYPHMPPNMPPQMPPHMPPNMNMPPPPGWPKFPGYPSPFGFDQESKDDTRPTTEGEQPSPYPQHHEESAQSSYEQFRNDMTPPFPYPLPQNNDNEERKAAPHSNFMPLPENIYEEGNNDEMSFAFDAAAPDMRLPGMPYPFPGHFPHLPPPPPPCPNMCDLELYKKCTCKTPAMYTKDGRGNCNVGASKLDLRVWCYVDDTNGKPSKLCPDAKPSKSKPGYWWSRIACITG